MASPKTARFLNRDEIIDQLKHLSLPDLKGVGEQLDELMRDKREAVKKDALRDVESLLRERYGEGLEILSTSRKRAQSVPRYAHPSDPKQTWTGIGQKPRWLRDAIAAGHDKEEFRIAD